MPDINIFRTNDFFIYFKNTIIVTSLSVMVLIFFASMASFALARFRFKGSLLIYSVFVAGVLLPQHASVIPLYVIVNKLGLYDKLLALVIPNVAFGLPLAVLILTSYMQSIPRELEEAAVIDGCNLFGLYTKIALPLSKPSVVTLVIFYSVWFWNEFLFPLILTSSRETRTLSLGIRFFVATRHVDYGTMLAGIFISIIPTMIVYSLLNEKIIKGMTVGALKG